MAYKFSKSMLNKNFKISRVKIARQKKIKQKDYPLYNDVYNVIRGAPAAAAASTYVQSMNLLLLQLLASSTKFEQKG